MEGPSLYLAQQQLRPFRKRRVLDATGNTRLDKTKFIGGDVRDIFSWGKHLVFQFDDFALRVHFMLWGSFEAEVDGCWVTGDYRRAREPRLALRFPNGVVNTYSCSLKLLDGRSVKRDYDFSVDIMSRDWDRRGAMRRTRAQPDAEISDVLLDQTVFAGVGNIIKNEVLALAGIAPRRRVRDLSGRDLGALVDRTRAFAWQFYRWRKRFVLTKHLRVHRRAMCPTCAARLTREKTGVRQRWAYWCPGCQR